MASGRAPATLLSLPELLLDCIAELLPQGDRYVPSQPIAGIACRAV